MPKILIVSADFNFATLLEARLLMDGHQVFTAGDGVLGLEKARELGPKLIILDAALPRMSGYQLVEKLKTSGQPLSHIPIIVVAQRARMEYLFRDADIFHFCSKPVIPAQFLKQVAAAVKAPEAPRAREEKLREDLRGKPRILLAGVEEFIVGKLQRFFEEKGFAVDLGWDEDDLVRKAAQVKFDHLFVQFWEELSVFDTPRVMQRLMQKGGPGPGSVFAFCHKNVLRDALLLLPRMKLIAFDESRDLLIEVGQALGLGQAVRDPGEPSS